MPGATAVGITYDNGVLLASEKRVSYGNFVVNKNTKKTFAVTDHVGAACAGMVADMQVLVRQVSACPKSGDWKLDGMSNQIRLQN